MMISLASIQKEIDYTVLSNNWIESNQSFFGLQWDSQHQLSTQQQCVDAAAMTTTTTQQEQQKS